jgi:hypothetical protein
MRILNPIIALLAPLLLSCDQQHSAPDLDPKAGLECFEDHRTSLPPGTQYEGVDEVAGSHLTIRVMTGAEVTTIECGLNPDGTLMNSGK